MATKLQSCRQLAAVEETFITEDPLDLEEVVSAVRDAACGALVTFSGSIRNTEKGASIDSITYEAYADLANKELARILQAARNRWGVRAALKHRIGGVGAGESAVVLAVASGHRKEAFEACQFIMDELKKSAPIWKVGFHECC